MAVSVQPEQEFGSQLALSQSCFRCMLESSKDALPLSGVQFTDPEISSQRFAELDPSKSRPWFSLIECILKLYPGWAKYSHVRPVKLFNMALE